jgi:hypothetical protein
MPLLWPENDEVNRGGFLRATVAKSKEASLKMVLRMSEKLLLNFGWKAAEGGGR